MFQWRESGPYIYSFNKLIENLLYHTAIILDARIIIASNKSGKNPHFCAVYDQGYRGQSCYETMGHLRRSNKTWAWLVRHPVIGDNRESLSPLDLPCRQGVLLQSGRKDCPNGSYGLKKRNIMLSSWLSIKSQRNTYPNLTCFPLSHVLSPMEHFHTPALHHSWKCFHSLLQSSLLIFQLYSFLVLPFNSLSSWSWISMTLSTSFHTKWTITYTSPNFAHSGDFLFTTAFQGHPWVGL